jgi:two-component system NtrC family sensor kinase
MHDSAGRRDFLFLERQILRIANQGIARIDFLRTASKLILEYTRCKSLDLLVRGQKIRYRWSARDGQEETYDFEPLPEDGDGECELGFEHVPVLKAICRMVVENSAPPGTPCFTGAGSFWCSDINEGVSLVGVQEPVELRLEDGTRSLALIPFLVDDRKSGLLLLRSDQPGRCNAEEVGRFEELAQTLGLAIADRRAQAELRERVKELACLYNISQIAEAHRGFDRELLTGVAEQLCSAFQFPDNAAVRVVFDDLDVRTDRWADKGPALETDITTGTERRGVVAVRYPSPTPEIDIDPFLPEETSLIDAVGRQVALLAERHAAESERERLQVQLRHADRLATIGQLSAGIAHELNEPLANVLGFAQLVARRSDLTEQVAADVARIEKAALHAREVIRKLMLFARQSPPQTGSMDLNELAEDGLYFLEGRCTKGGIALRRELAADMPLISADPGQLLQVLINLVVNAIQAMPHGGTLTIRTGFDKEWVTLEVGDTGVGIPEDVRRKVFLPFFTTKDVDEGTGLGLAVVHGIVTAHGGAVDVDSKVGVGSTFRVRLPRLSDGRVEKGA